MIAKNQVQPAPDFQGQIRQLKQENQRLRDTIALLKEQLRKEHVEREMYFEMHSKAEIEVQMLKKALADLESSRKEGPLTSRTHTRPPLPLKQGNDSSFQQSSMLNNSAVRSILKKKNSNLSNLDNNSSKRSETGHESLYGLKTLKDMRAINSNSTTSLRRAETSTNKNIQFGSKVEKKEQEVEGDHASLKRRTYFDKVSQG